MKLLNSIGKALFGMTTPSVKEGDLFWIPYTGDGLWSVDDKSEIQLTKGLFLDKRANEIKRLERITSLNKISIGDKLISKKGVIKTIENKADIGLIASYKENWYKIIPL